MSAHHQSPPSLPTPLLPAGLGAGEQYWLVGDPADGLTREVASLLAWASPAAILTGAGHQPPPGTTAVLFRHDSLDQAARLAASGTQVGPLRFMPIPFGYPWAFWDTWMHFADRPDLWHCLPAFESYRHFFVRSPYLGGEAHAHINRWDSLRDSALYWTAARPHFDAHARELTIVRAGLADDRSRATFDMVLASEPRQLWHHYLATIFATTDYLDDDVPVPGEHVLNLGVFTGHELPYFSALMGESGVVHCIDPVGLDLLSDYARQHLASRSVRTVEARFAASATAGTARFRSYPDGQVCLDDGGEPGAREFVTATVDDYVRSASLPSVGFIKIDIEGMELEALEGMRETLQRHRPTLSLAIYHEPEHLWRIPLRLMEMLRDYRFHVSHTSPVRWETVLTAVPRERPARSIRALATAGRG